MSPKINFITVRLQHEGFHQWDEAPPSLDFLRSRHRHMFHFIIELEVIHADRAVEFIVVKNQVSRYLEAKYRHDFGGMSCEQLAHDIGKWLTQVQRYKVRRIEVQEDGENGGGVIYG